MWRGVAGRRPRRKVNGQYALSIDLPVHGIAGQGLALDIALLELNHIVDGVAFLRLALGVAVHGLALNAAVCGLVLGAAVRGLALGAAVHGLA